MKLSDILHGILSIEPDFTYLRSLGIKDEDMQEMIESALDKAIVLIESIEENMGA